MLGVNCNFFICEFKKLYFLVIACDKVGDNGIVENMSCASSSESEKIGVFQKICAKTLATISLLYLKRKKIKDNSIIKLHLTHLVRSFLYLIVLVLFLDNKMTLLLNH